MPVPVAGAAQFAPPVSCLSDPPALAGNRDREVVQEVIKEIAQNHAINTGSAARSFKGAPAAPAPLLEPSSFLTLAAV